jgi:hypothetical protein
MRRRRAASARHVRGRLSVALLGAALASWALPAQSADPAGPIALTPPPSTGTSLSLDGRDMNVLPGLSVPFAHLGRALDGPWISPRLVTAAQILALLSLNAALYWSNPDKRLRRAELTWSWDSWRSKLITMQGVSFDANDIDTNAVLHPIAGTLYYMASRGNGLGMAESLLFSAAGSALWEYLVEYPEEVSLNDLVITPAAGVAIGEPLHRLGLFFALPAEPWHRFHVFAGALAIAREARVRSAGALLGLDVELIDLPWYGRPGRSARVVPGGSFVRIAAEAALDAGGLASFDFVSTVALAGYLWQAIAVGPDGLMGGSLFAGASTAYSYTHDASVDFVDKIGAANLVGPALDLSLHRGPLRLRARLDAYIDFAMVRSAAIEAYLDRRDPRGIQSVAAEKKYYYATGLTFRPALSLGYRGFELGARIGLDLFESIEGLDRRRREVDNEVHLSDRRLRGRAWLACTLPGQRLRISVLDVERREREGRIGGLRVVSADTRIMSGIGLLF